MVNTFGSAIWPVTVPNVRIALGSDERTNLTDAVADDLRKRGHEVVLVGPPGGEDIGWAEVGRRVGALVAGGETDTAVLCCWTGTGASIAANKVAGVRAALAWSEETATLARQHNDANVVSVGGRMHTVEDMTRFVLTFLTTSFSGEERHQRRIDMLADYEKTRNLPPLPESAVGLGPDGDA
jgi:ribose 5-phosphate isomerase B